MATIYTDDEITKLREGGKRLARILKEVAKSAVPGAHTKDLDALAEKLIREGGDEPSLKGYKPQFAKRPYPSTICISVNNEVVHGIPSENDWVLEDGDIVGLDLVITHQGLMTDSTITVGVGKVDAKGKKLIAATEEALMAGIKAARAGKYIGDIGKAVQKVGEKYGYGVVYELGGHGVGHHVHEKPYISNVAGDPGEKLVPGMVLAIEPMLNEGGSGEVRFLPDGYTVVTQDGSRSAHFEHTILITDGAPEILTKL